MTTEVQTWPDSGLGDIPVVGVNAKETNVSASIQIITRNSAIPFLQDTSSEHLWNDAAAVKDDVYILDAQRRIARVFSCYTYDLASKAGRDSLRTWVRQAAGVSTLANGDAPARRGTETIAAPAASSSQISPRR